jgi:PAS domain S-box-containing protein
MAAAPAAVVRWLRQEQQAIIEEWVERLSRLSRAYRRRPRPELYGTVGQALDANLEALATGRLEGIERFIDYITQKRLQAGFPLSDVQKAFELFRTIVHRLLLAQGNLPLLAAATEPVNTCLSHTIHRFSDHFQHMHERAIRHHAQNLEQEIAARTAELADSERRYKTLVEEISDGYFIIAEGRIAFANQAFCQMHGARLPEVAGRRFRDFVVPEDRERVEAAYGRALDGRPRSGALEYRRLGCPPDIAATEIRSRLVELDQGPALIGICRDISARVAMEAKVREHERLAYVGHLTASLSHEIRNPLSAVKMNLQLLARRLELDGFDRRRLEIVVQQVSRLEGILHQLLDRARPLCLQPGPVDLAGLAAACLELMEPKAAERGLALGQRHPRNLPRVRADAGRLEQAVLNLLLNAIEAAPAGGWVEVRTKADRARRWAELSVRDNGPGVAVAHKKRLFEPFYTTKSRGTGLGLSNVKRILEAHGGSVEVRSRPGRGANFIVRLPCRP